MESIGILLTEKGAHCAIRNVARVVGDTFSLSCALLIIFTPSEQPGARIDRYVPGQHLTQTNIIDTKAPPKGAPGTRTEEEPTIFRSRHPYSNKLLPLLDCAHGANSCMTRFGGAARREGQAAALLSFRLGVEIEHLLPNVQLQVASK